MSGYSDGVSKLWILTIDRRALDVEGYTDEHEAIDRLIRHRLTFTTWSNEALEAEKAHIRAKVEKALTHLDDDEKEDSEDEAT